MRYLLDTNIVSYYLRRSSKALEDRLNKALRQQDCAISVLTRAELRYGQMNMEAGDRRRALVDGFLQLLPSLAWTSHAADRYGEIKSALRRAGRPVGELDTQIASHAMAEGLVLVTHNTRHFRDVPALALEDWMA